MCNFFERTSLTNEGLARQSEWCWVSCFAALASNSLLTCSFDPDEGGQLAVLARPPGPLSTFFFPSCVRATTSRLPSRLAYPPHPSAIKPARRYFISQNYCGLDDISDRKALLVPPHCGLAQFLKQSSCFTTTWSLLSLFPYRDRPPALFVHHGARVFLCKHIHVGLNKCRPLVLWPELTRVCASRAGVTPVTLLFFSALSLPQLLFAFIKDCTRVLLKLARVSARTLQARATLPVSQEAPPPHKQRRGAKQLGASAGCCHFWWRWCKERGQDRGNWWQMGCRRARGSQRQRMNGWSLESQLESVLQRWWQFPNNFLINVNLL